MKRLSLLIILIPTAMLAVAAEPVGVATRAKAAAEQTKKSAVPAPRRKAVAVQSSVLSSDTLAALPAPGVLHPDLVPEGTSFISSCSWNESAGETCESKCPPIVINLPFGAKNASNRALADPGVVRVFDRNAGAFVGNYAFNGLPANGQYKPASVKRLIVRCHPPGQASVGAAPPPTHDIVVETQSPEVDKNNNSRPFHVGPNDELVLP
jgi:hypothetical protein